MKLYAMEPQVLEKKVLKDTQKSPKRKKPVVADEENQSENVPPAPKKGKKKMLDQPETPVKKSKKQTKPVQKEPETEVVITKKEKTPKQLEAIERRKQARLEKQAAEEALKKEIEAKELELAAKKEAQKEKRRQARLAKKSNSGSITMHGGNSISENLDELFTEPAVAINDKDDLTREFKQHVSAIKKAERAVAKPSERKQVIAEVEAEAQSKWRDDGYRSQIKNELLNSRSKMHNMIFPNRPLRM